MPSRLPESPGALLTFGTLPYVTCECYGGGHRTGHQAVTLKGEFICSLPEQISFQVEKIGIHPRGKKARAPHRVSHCGDWDATRGDALGGRGLSLHSPHPQTPLALSWSVERHQCSQGEGLGPSPVLQVEGGWVDGEL